MPTGYCTVADVRHVLQETTTAFESGALAEDNNQAVVNAIASQNEWLRSRTSRHWYTPDGVTGDSHDLAPTEPRTQDREEQDIPSTPHSGPSQMQTAAAKQARYPLQNNSPYTRIRLDKHYADSLSALEVQDASGGWTDWVADSDYEEGKDYELYVEAGSTSSPSHVDLRARLLPRLANYDNAIRVTYDYGRSELPQTVRRAVALKTAAELLAPDDEAALGIPENANLVAVESKVQALERQAEEKLEAYQ